MRIPASKIVCIPWNVNANSEMSCSSLGFACERHLMGIQMLLSYKMAVAVFVGWFMCCTVKNCNIHGLFN